MKDSWRASGDRWRKCVARPVWPLEGGWVVRVEGAGEGKGKYYWWFVVQRGERAVAAC